MENSVENSKCPFCGHDTLDTEEDPIFFYCNHCKASFNREAWEGAKRRLLVNETVLDTNGLYYSKLLALSSWIRRTYIPGTCPFDAFYPCPSMKREVVRVMGCTPDCQCDCDGDWREPHHIHADLCWQKFIIDSDVKAWRKED